MRPRWRTYLAGIEQAVAAEELEAAVEDLEIANGQVQVRGAPDRGLRLKDLADKTYDAQAGGGLVRVTVDGKGTVRSLHLDPVAFEGRDPELLADLILGAIAEAQRRAADALQQEVGRVSPLPFNFPL